MRFLFASSMSAALLFALAAPGLAETDKQRAKRCAAQGEIVAQAVEMRVKRKSETKAKAAIMETVDEKIAPSVPILVGYIYTLSRKDLKQDVPAAFVEQCNGFKP